jgi:ABC-2 type transport system permease protein
VGNPFAAPKIEKVPMSSQVDMKLFVPSAFNLFCLGFFLAGLSTWFSSFDRYRWRTLGLTVAFFVLSIVAKVVGVALIKSESPWLAKFSNIRWLSIFTAYEPQKLVEYGMRRETFLWTFVDWSDSPWHIEFGPVAWYAVLISFGLIFYAAAIATFNRRDLPAPL